MSLKSQKFKYLDELQALGPKMVPQFIQIIDSLPHPEFSGPYIMRSAIQGEAQADRLQSGKSLSFPNLNVENLSPALKQIKAQENVEEIILQKQISWTYHLTVLSEKDFFFAEMKNTEGQSQFFYQSEMGGTQSQLRELLSSEIEQLKAFLSREKLWLMEWGFDGKDLYLFQIQPVSFQAIKSIFSSELAFQMIQSKERFSKGAGLFQLLSTEWKAYKYRQSKKKNLNFESKDVFLNWEFIFHYFRLFCLARNLVPNEDGLEAFYKNLSHDNFFSKNCKTHFALANQYRQHEQFPQFQFQGSRKKRFMGKGKKLFQKSEIIFEVELDPAKIYKLREPKLILTKSLSLLGHGILAALEQGHFVVSGISDEEWDELLKKDQIYLDFEREELDLK